MGEEHYVWLTTKFMCRTGLKIESGCGLKFSARGQGFITTFFGGVNNKSLRMWTMPASSKLNQTHLPHSLSKFIWKVELLPLTIQQLLNHVHMEITQWTCPCLSTFLHIRSSTVRETQSTDIGKGLISSLKSLEMLHWLNWAKIKALEMVTSTL